MKKCKEGHYYCYQDSKCKPIPKGFRRGVGGYLRREREDEKEDSKKNGNGNGKSNGSSNGNGNGGNGSGNGNGSSGGNGGGNGSGGVGESVEIQNSDGETTALVTDIIGPDHMRPRLNGKGVWTGTHITEVKFGGYLGGVTINPSASRNQYGLPDNMKPESGSGIKEVPLTPTHNRLLVKDPQNKIDSEVLKANPHLDPFNPVHYKKLKRLSAKVRKAHYEPDGELIENTVALPFFLKTINKTNALKKLRDLGTAGIVYQAGKEYIKKKFRPKEKEDRAGEFYDDIPDNSTDKTPQVPNMDDKLNTPLEDPKFSGGKKIDARTRRRMNAPETQFNSYDPLTERKKISGKALFPFKANVKIKNEIISDDGISTKNPVDKKLQDEYIPERKMTEKEKRKDQRMITMMGERRKKVLKRKHNRR